MISSMWYFGDIEIDWLKGLWKLAVLRNANVNVNQDSIANVLVGILNTMEIRSNTSVRTLPAQA